MMRCPEIGTHILSWQIIPDVSCQNKCYDREMKILLKEIMERKNLSLRQVEIASGVSRSALSRICRGEVSPSMEEMEQLAKGLHMKITELFESPYE